MSPEITSVEVLKFVHLTAPPKTMLDGMKTINVGDSLHLYCKTAGYPTPSVVWKKNGRSLSELSSRVTFLPYGGLDNGHLVVFDVSGSEAGEYTCEAKSSYFSSASSRLQVDVKGECHFDSILRNCFKEYSIFRGLTKYMFT